MNAGVKVPIKNIYYMLCYAWNVKDYIDETVCGSEEFDNIFNLLARILVKEVSTLIKRGFYKGYIEVEEETSKIKGQIKITDSIAKMTMTKKQLVCSYDDYSSDILFNQIVKSTLLDFLKYDQLDNELKKKVKNLSASFMDVSYISVSKKDFTKLRFSRNNLNYQIIINVCKLFRYGLIANQEEGKLKFANFINEDQMATVYEKFILNFYKLNLDSNKYRVHSPKISWHLSDDLEDLEGEFEVEKNPGDRRTDVVIENKVDNIQFIIDAKYYKEMLVNKYYDSDSLTYRVSHLSQVKGYIDDSDFNGKKRGALLYPTVVEDTKYAKGALVNIVGSMIIVKSLDLNASWDKIKNDLLTFARKVVK